MDKSMEMENMMRVTCLRVCLHAWQNSKQDSWFWTEFEQGTFQVQARAKLPSHEHTLHPCDRWI